MGRSDGRPCGKFKKSRSIRTAPPHRRARASRDAQRAHVAAAPRARRRTAATSPPRRRAPNAHVQVGRGVGDERREQQPVGPVSSVASPAKSQSTQRPPLPPRALGELFEGAVGEDGPQLLF